MSSNNLREYDPSGSTSNPSTAYIDLATYSELEKKIYGTKSYFVRETTKSSWFTQIPIKMKLNTSNPNFNQTFTADIPRTGDYLLHAWLRVTLNAVSIYNPSVTGAQQDQGGSETILWTPNFMHHLVKHSSLKINGMVVDEIYSEYLDFYTAFTIPKGSRSGYNRMVGNFCSPFNGLAGINVCGSKARKYPNLNTSQELFLPLPFFFSKDTGLALPMAALPYARAEIKFEFRNWDELLQSLAGGGIGSTKVPNIAQFNGQTPTLSNVQVWGNYAIVSRKERALMGCKPRDLIIEQGQQINGEQGSSVLNTNSMSSTSLVDLRLNGAVKALFFAARDVSYNYRSNYACNVPSASDITVTKVSISGINVSASIQNSVTLTGAAPTNIHLNWYTQAVSDFSGIHWFQDYLAPIGTASILYENTPRIRMECFYYTLIQPYSYAKNIPQSDAARNILKTKNPNEVCGDNSLTNGYFMYSYSLHIGKIDPCGSTNYGKLSNATLSLTPTRQFVNATANGSTKVYTIYVCAINHNVIRISGGTLGFPIS